MSQDSYFMSIGRLHQENYSETDTHAEISKMNYTLDETASVLQELKSELSIRKASRKIDVSNSTTVVEVAGISHGEDEQHEVMEIDQLEAELETELRKLPWCASDGSKSVEQIDNFEIEQYEDIHDLNFSQSFGVSPGELEEKLYCKQQEKQILELESELQQTNAKLSEKEAELQTLKECVRRLTDFSLASASDEETKVQNENDKTFHQEKVREYESNKSKVGMKRGWSFTHITASPSENTH